MLQKGSYHPAQTFQAHCKLYWSKSVDCLHFCEVISTTIIVFHDCKYYPTTSCKPTKPKTISWKQIGKELKEKTKALV